MMENSGNFDFLKNASNGPIKPCGSHPSFLKIVIENYTTHIPEHIRPEHETTLMSVF